MNNFDLGKALKEYRDKHNLTMQKMGDKLSMSKSSYERLENNKRKPTYDEVSRIMEELEFKVTAGDISAIPNPPRKWYRSRKWNWVIPIVIAYLFLGLMYSSIYFREGYGEEKLQTNPPTAALIVVGAIFCAIYWYYWPPEWPFKKSRKS